MRNLNTDRLTIFLEVRDQKRPNASNRQCQLNQNSNQNTLKVTVYNNKDILGQHRIFESAIVRIFKSTYRVNTIYL